jgi:Na+-transporting NADH:ubiquinone oxidoreductase subunit F
MIEIALGVALFTAIVVVLVLAILAARSRLVATGTVAVTVNESKAIEASTGDKLLTALSAAGIHLPSACGGVGTCGQCRVRVTDGGGAILPTERASITKREAALGDRLACQVTVKRDMAVRVPDEVFGVKRWDCTVRSNRNIATLIKEVHCPPYRARFTEFDIAPDYRGEWDRLDLWRYEARTAEATTRAYSLANYPAENTEVRLDIRIAIPPPAAPDTVPPGVVSSYLFGLAPGDTLAVLGPYGNFFATDSDAEMVFVGGGVGMAPMRAHIFDHLLRLKSGRKITFWYGARNRREIIYKEDFDRLQAAHDNFDWFVALSDPEPADDWQGMTGFVHDMLYEHYLKDHPAPEACEYYLCGPPMMIRAVRNMLDSLGVDPDNIFFDDFGG